MRLLGGVAERDGVKLRETCLEIVLQFVSIIFIRYLFAEPRRFEMAVKSRTEGKLAGKCRGVVLVIVDVDSLSVRALTVLFLHLDGLSSLTPSEVAAV